MVEHARELKATMGSPDCEVFLVADHKRNDVYKRPPTGVRKKHAVGVAAAGASAEGALAEEGALGEEGALAEGAPPDGIDMGATEEAEKKAAALEEEAEVEARAPDALKEALRIAKRVSETEEPWLHVCCNPEDAENMLSAVSLRGKSIATVVPDSDLFIRLAASLRNLQARLRVADPKAAQVVDTGVLFSKLASLSRDWSAARRVVAGDEDAVGEDAPVGQLTALLILWLCGD
jgi:hypothetical protein